MSDLQFHEGVVGMSALHFLFPQKRVNVDGPEVTDGHRAKLEALGAVYAVVEMDAKGYFVDANDRFLHAVGYRLDELVGKHHRTLMPPEDARSSAYAAHWATLLEGRGLSAEFKRVRKDGRAVWLRAAYCPIRDADGAITGVIKLAQDATAEREALWRGQAVVEMSLDGHVIDANPVFLEMLGYTREELLGQPHSALVTPDCARSADYANHWRKLREGEFVSGTFERVGKGGRRVVMRASYNPIFDQDGHPQKIVKYASDVTALQSSVEQIRAVVSQLGESTSALSDSSGQLEETAEATKGQAAEISTRSSEIAHAMQSVSAATEEFSSSVAEIANTSATAAADAQAGRTAADTATEAVGQLNAVSQRIFGVVDLIRRIADQTNLLALNATIEAASAGKAGLGFRVVADEVKTLSNETARATGEIANQVADIVRIAGTTTDAVEALSSVISAMVDRQISLAATAEQQQAVTLEIAGHAGRVAAGMSEATEQVAQLSASAENTRGVAADVGSAVDAIGRVSEQLRRLSSELDTVH